MTNNKKLSFLPFSSRYKPFLFIFISAALLFLINSCADDAVEGGGSCKDSYKCVQYSGSQYSFLEQSTKCTDEFIDGQCPSTDVIGFCVKNAGKQNETRLTYYSSFTTAIGDSQTECLGDNGTYSVP